MAKSPQWRVYVLFTSGATRLTLKFLQCYSRESVSECRSGRRASFLFFRSQLTECNRPGQTGVDCSRFLDVCLTTREAAGVGTPKSCENSGSGPASRQSRLQRMGRFAAIEGCRRRLRFARSYRPCENQNQDTGTTGRQPHEFLSCGS